MDRGRPLPSLPKKKEKEITKKKPSRFSLQSAGRRLRPFMAAGAFHVGLRRLMKTFWNKRNGARKSSWNRRWKTTGGQWVGLLWLVWLLLDSLVEMTTSPRGSLATVALQRNQKGSHSMEISDGFQRPQCDLLKRDASYVEIVGRHPRTRGGLHIDVHDKKEKEKEKDDRARPSFSSFLFFFVPVQISSTRPISRCTLLKSTLGR